MADGVSKTAHNELIKHASSTMNNIGMGVFGVGVIEYLIDNGPSASYGFVAFCFCAWLVLFVISSYVLCLLDE